MFDALKPYRKAIIAGVVAGVAIFLKAYADETITAEEWWQIIAAVAGGAGLTWAIPNAPTQPAPKLLDKS